MYSEDNLKYRLQKEILKVFGEFKKICEKHNLKYFAIGGTCIGAVRHSGFIPWDDDLDVAMPIHDYKKFIELSKTELPDGFGLLTPDNCKHYLSTFMKLHNLDTTYIEEISKKYSDRYGGIYMDIFPIYGLPKNEKQIKKLQKKCQFYKQMNLRLRFPISDSINSGIIKKIVWLLCAPTRCFLRFNYFTKKIDLMLSKYSFDDCEKIIFPWRSIPNKNVSTYNDIFYKDDFISEKIVPFEEMLISIPNGYDRYLKFDFGDYMTLPPESQRVAQHAVAVIDFEKSYTFYKRNKNF